MVFVKSGFFSPVFTVQPHFLDVSSWWRWKDAPWWAPLASGWSSQASFLPKARGEPTKSINRNSTTFENSRDLFCWHTEENPETDTDFILKKTQGKRRKNASIDPATLIVERYKPSRSLMHWYWKWINLILATIRSRYFLASERQNHNLIIFRLQ